MFQVKFRDVHGGKNLGDEDRSIRNETLKKHKQKLETNFENSDTYIQGANYGGLGGARAPLNKTRAPLKT